MEKPAAETPKVEAPKPVTPAPGGKKRHGCLTAWLIIIIIACAVSIIMYLATTSLISSELDMAGWVVPVLVILLVFEIVCAIALFMWKKWGFWGFCAIVVISIIINLSLGLGITASLGGLVGLAILFGVLNIGKDNKGWPQLN